MSWTLLLRNPSSGTRGKYVSEFMNRCTKRPHSLSRSRGSARPFLHRTGPPRSPHATGTGRLGSLSAALGYDRRAARAAGFPGRRAVEGAHSASILEGALVAHGRVVTQRLPALGAAAFRDTRELPSALPAQLTEITFGHRSLLECSGHPREVAPHAVPSSTPLRAHGQWEDCST